MKGHRKTTGKKLVLIIILSTIMLFSTALIMQGNSSAQTAVAQGIFPSHQNDLRTNNAGQPHSLDIPTPTISANRAPAPKTEKVLVLRAQLAGALFSADISLMRTMFKDSVKAYYTEVSYNLVVMNTTFITNNYTLTHTDSYYSANIESLVSDTVKAANNDVSTLGGYSAFRHIVIVHSGPDKAVTHLSTDIGSEFVFRNGGPLIDIPGIRIMNASIVSQYDPLGVVVHELGHSLGLPDLYSYQGEDLSAIDTFMGAWDLMATGSWTPSGQGTSPSHLTTWSKIKLHWIDATQIVNMSQSDIQSGVNKTVFLDPQERTDRNLAIRILLSNGTYFLIENRQAIGYDGSIPAKGVLILFCDDSKLSGYGPARVVSAHPPSLGADAVFNVGFFAKDFYGNLALNVGVKVLNKWDNGTMKVLVGRYNPVYNAPTEYKDPTVPVIFGIAMIVVISIVSITVYIKRGRRRVQNGRQEVTVIKIS